MSELEKEILAILAEKSDAVIEYKNYIIGGKTITDVPHITDKHYGDLIDFDTGHRIEEIYKCMRQCNIEEMKYIESAMNKK